MAETIKIFDVTINTDAAVAELLRLKKEASALKETFADAEKMKELDEVQTAKLAIQYKILSDQIRTQEKYIKNYTIANDLNNNSIENTKAALAAVTIEWNKEAKAFGENSERAKQLAAEKLRLTEALKKEESSTGNFTRNVGNYSDALSGLKMSMAQITREAPSMAVSMNTFFLAISNNIPMLVDEINKLKESNKVAATEGKKQTSILSGLGQAFFSWNTAISVGVSLLSVYGGELIKWAGKLFTATEKTKALNNANLQFLTTVNAINQARLAGEKNAVKDIEHLKILYAVTQDASLSMKDRKKAVDELQKLYPSYFGKMTDEQVLLGKAKTQYDNLTVAILENAKARAIEDKMVELEKEKIELNRKRIGLMATEEVQLDKLRKFYKDAPKDQISSSFGRGIASAYSKTLSENEKLANSTVKNLRDQRKVVESEITGITNAQKRLAKELKGQNILDVDKKEVEKKQGDMFTQTINNQLNIYNVIRDKNKEIVENEKLTVAERLDALNGIKSEFEKVLSDESAIFEKSTKKKIDFNELLKISDSETLEAKIKGYGLDAKKSENLLNTIKEFSEERKYIANAESELYIENMQNELKTYNEAKQSQLEADELYRKQKLELLQLDYDNTIENTDAQAQAYKKLMDAKLQAEEEYYIKIGATETQILNLRKKYADAEKSIERAKNDAKMESYLSLAQGIKAVAKENTLLYKAAAIAETVISTYSTAQKAYESQFVPADSSSPYRGAAAAAAAVAVGLANVAKIVGVNFDSENIQGVSASNTTPTSIPSGSPNFTSSGTNFTQSNFQTTQNQEITNAIKEGFSSVEMRPVLVTDDVTVSQNSSAQRSRVASI